MSVRANEAARRRLGSAPRRSLGLNGSAKDAAPEPARGSSWTGRRRLLGLSGTGPFLLAAVLVFAGCYTGPAAGHFLGILDELAIPAGWEVAQTVVRGPDQTDFCNPGVSTECPAARRYFVTSADLTGAYDEAKSLASEAGFSIGDESTTGCASGLSGARPCGFFADRGDDQIHVRVYFSPDAAGLDDGTAGGVTVVVRAYGTG